MGADIGLLRFKPLCFERIWGGRKLRDTFGLDAPADQPVGEAWLVADHPQCESVVVEGPFAGRTLRELLREDSSAILGTRAELTIHGRFPLLLKLLDAAEVLSVQVHPNDDTAAELGEPDVGKTEMWYVLDAEPGSELICGLTPHASRENLAQAVADGTVETLMNRFPVQVGSAIFVPAGMVHAIGAGILLAEIQQNSDLTYRLYDWGRLESDGRPRALHVDKALPVIDFTPVSGLAHPLILESQGIRREVLAACRYFATERLAVDGSLERRIGGTTVHILLAVTGTLTVSAGPDEAQLNPGQAVLVAGGRKAFVIDGSGTVIDYYVPDLQQDIAQPLRACGHSEADIARLIASTV
ncbi:MAG: Mannose-6-phosphate isomerase [Candidatus Hydrogenedentes bacterium]|nr:Mannose-6-phosphate isomerase [Candidatus Hydrogenedentota bacterium]